jgi:hypothetical protein
MAAAGALYLLHLDGLLWPLDADNGARRALVEQEACSSSGSLSVEAATLSSQARYSQLMPDMPSTSRRRLAFLPIE